MPFAVSSNENNHVHVFVRAYQESTDRSWEVIDTYSSGTGYVTRTTLPSSVERDCAIDIGCGSYNLGELISTRFEYQGDFTADEKEIIEWFWEQSRSKEKRFSRFFDLFDEGWFTSTPTMIIPAPFVIEQISHKKWLDNAIRFAYNTLSN